MSGKPITPAAQRLDDLRETPSQTAGPYVHIGLAPRATGIGIYERELGWDIAGPNALGQRIRVEGTLRDGTGSPVKDALLECWQANSAGHFAHPDGGGTVEDGFRGWGRAITDFKTGLWGLETVKPGAIAGAAGRPPEAPHLNLWIVARGINLGLHTRMYFEDEPEANAVDPVLTQIEWETRRATLLARRVEGQGIATYRFDICLQGEHETVFFDV